MPGQKSCEVGVDPQTGQLSAGAGLLKRRSEATGLEAGQRKMPCSERGLLGDLLLAWLAMVTLWMF